MPALDRSRRDTASFLLCLALSVAGLFLPPRTSDHVAAAVRRTVLAPLVWLQQRAVEGRTSRGRFDAAEAQRDTAVLRAQGLEQLQGENAALRLLLGLRRRPEFRFVPAEILHQPQPTDGRSLLLGAGARQGVEPFQPVVAPEGLLGVVRSVDEGHAVAMTWADPEFRASAVTADGAVSGIVAATAAESPSLALLELRGVPFRDSVAVGTVVVTSGLGGVYPRGIPVGTVLAQVRVQEGWERVYLLRPSASPSSAVHVMVVTGTRASTVAPAFLVDTAIADTQPRTVVQPPAVPPARRDTLRRRPVRRPAAVDSAPARPPARTDTAPAPAPAAPATSSAAARPDTGGPS
ncbi:MAG TPA: rod shape-determining protein MreC [Gemmatimonadales bacterium]|nr:rod shape-determining protein MreC [Gemmatimonadales bacterium]